MGQEYRRLGYMSCAIECLLQFADNSGITKFYAERWRKHPVNWLLKN